jgi:hypothetical protein
MTKFITLVATCGLLLSACGSSTELVAPTPAPTVPAARELKSPAGPGSAQPDVAVGPDGRVYLSWLEPEATDGFTLRFSVREGDGWSAPKTIAKATNWFVSHVDFPMLTVLSDGTLAANSLVATGGPRSEAYDIDLMFSKDNGATWSKPVAPHRDRSKRQHGFPAFVATPDAKLATIWLDGRKMPSEFEGNMALMYTTVGSDGTLGPETLLDDRTCECCQTAMTATPDGLVAVYRDRSDKEIRDISIVRYTGGKWSKPEGLSMDGWEIDGCPINGPAISSNGTKVAVAWLTALEDKGRVFVLMSNDSGVTFGKKIQVDGGNPLGRVDVVSLPSGAAMVSWIEAADSGAEVRLRQVDPDGVLGAPVNISGALGALSGGLPRMQVSGNEIVMAWTDSAEPSQVRTVAIKF